MVTARSQYDQTIAETEAAYSKVWMCAIILLRLYPTSTMYYI
jgi:hypothetical protein